LIFIFSVVFLVPCESDFYIQCITLALISLIETVELQLM